MPEAAPFPFVAVDPTAGEVGYMPVLPMTLINQGRSVNVSALLDTGSTVNVLPYHVGQELGAVWSDADTPLRLTGNLARFEARPLLVQAKIQGFDPVGLIFA